MHVSICQNMPLLACPYHYCAKFMTSEMQANCAQLAQTGALLFVFLHSNLETNCSIKRYKFGI